MKTGTVLLLGGLAVGAYYLSQLGVAANTVNIVFNGATPASLTQWQLQVVVQNVSNAAVNLNALSGNVMLNGNNVGNVSYFPTAPAQIAPTSQQVLNLQLNLNLLSLPTAIQNLIQSPAGNTLNFEIVGNANINSLVLPFDVKYPVTM